ncbi:hypothetical protein MPRG_65400 [Mycobacterium paragordonae]|uniref:Uncharacterized protein n=1 Tax=Mycobacterium paragordonae TaxID=1389713 RepID=A0ABQ1CFQ1_9MYCO|nr:hypothetical protein MPRG_65400 [Mycobacterium paragordonae]
MLAAVSTRRSAWVGGWSPAHPGRGNDEPDYGWLIAYAIDCHDAKTGRCVVIAGPWDSATDDRLQCASPPEDDTSLDGLIDWLRTQM